MPNTLVHIGVNGLTSRSLIGNADLKWIYIGCIIPDIPWILLRIVKEIPGVNLYDLRLYSIIQASLLFSLVLSAAISFFSKSYRKTFLILSLGSLIHLLSDAFEIKWANGVHLFATFNWSLLNYGIVWPESLLIDSLTLFGLIYFFWNWKNAAASPPELSFRNPKYNLLSVLLLLIYFALPFTLLNYPRSADNHYIKTLSTVNNRTGSYLELDRRHYDSERKTINTFANEDLNAEGINLDHSVAVSIKAKFINNKTVQVIEYHEHNTVFRDGASYLAFMLIAIVWIVSLSKFKNKF
jgi:hypothetical protein